jgi:outer membrane protein OmpA-like peptidoglycan-associated protein
MTFRFFTILLLVLLSACSSSRVILLDNGKQQNAIVIKTDAGETILDKTNSYADISKTCVSEIKPLSLTELQKSYGELIADAPKPPIEIQLYFKLGGTSLTAASKKQRGQVIQAITERTPCDVNIIGHTDSTGTKQYNIDLSLQRAQSIKGWILSQNLDIKNIYVESYGEEDPLIPTADGVPEPRNRRVEILIR